MAGVGGPAFSFKVWPRDISWADLRDIWVAADAGDCYQGGWLFDHFYPPRPGQRGALFEAVGVETADGAKYRASRAVLSTIHIKHLIEMAPSERATTHPGGSVSGAPGRNAAAVMLKDLGTSIEEVING